MVHESTRAAYQAMRGVGRLLLARRSARQLSTSSVRPGHSFDVSHVLRELQEHGVDSGEGWASVSSDKVSILQFTHGQSNPTFLLDFDGMHKAVLRKKPPGKLLRGAHNVAREFRCMQALGKSGVPVPQMYHLHEEPEPEPGATENQAVNGIGTSWFLCEYVQGRHFKNPSLRELDSARARREIYEGMNDALAALAAADPEHIGLADYGKKTGYFERQLRTWSKQYAASATDEIATMDSLIRGLPALVPDSNDKCSVAHGDFRLDNLIFHAHEPRVLAVLDWELSTLGHPLADLAYNCMVYHLPEIDDDAIPIRGICAPGARSAEAHVALGMPSEEEYVQRWCERSGVMESVSDDEWSFALSFSFFRAAAILQGVYKRALDGNASASNAAEVGAMARGFADKGHEFVRHRL